jgi:hypothetical protein
MKHKNTPAFYNKTLGEKNIRLKMHTHKLSLDEGIKNLNYDKKVVLESPSLMQQHNFDVLLYEEE